MTICVHPIAFGRDRSEKELHVWDPECGLESFYPRYSTIRCDCEWGAGMVEEAPALILYLFDGDRTIEIVFAGTVAVGPGRKMHAWDVLFAMEPESLVLVHGEKPTDRDRWLKVKCRQGLTESLYAFIDRAMELDTSKDPVLTRLAGYFSNLEGDACPTRP